VSYGSKPSSRFTDVNFSLMEKLQAKTMVSRLQAVEGVIQAAPASFPQALALKWHAPLQV
jgi:hypothetical protein